MRKRSWRVCKILLLGTVHQAQSLACCSITPVEEHSTGQSLTASEKLAPTHSSFICWHLELFTCAARVWGGIKKAFRCVSPEAIGI